MIMSEEGKARNERAKYNFSGAQIGNLAEVVKGSASQNANIYNYDSEQKQTLAEAAAEIQQLLDQLAATNPAETLSGRIVVAGKAIEAIEQNPTQREKIVKALRNSGIVELKQMIKPALKPLTNILFPMLEELN
jgi:hypothetical protein